MARLDPAPGSDLGSALDDEVGQVSVVVVHHPEQCVPQGDVPVLQVGSVYHQVAGNLLSLLLEQGSLAGELEGTGGSCAVSAERNSKTRRR